VIPYMPYAYHEVTAGRQFYGSELCTAGWDDANKQPCVVCHGAADLPTGSNLRIARRFQNAVNILVLADFHLVPVTDRKGNPIISKGGENEGKQIREKQPCEGRRCEHCEKDHELVFGAKRYLSLGPNFQDNIMSIDVGMSQTCFCGGYLTVATYLCPLCGEVAFDVQKSRLTDDEIEDVISRPFRTCPNCGENDVHLLPRYLCDRCEEPQPLSLLPEEEPIIKIPAVVWLSKSGEGTSSKIEKMRHKPATEFLIPTNDEPLVSIDEDEDGNMILIWNPDIASMTTQFDFDAMLLREPTSEILQRQTDLVRKALPDFRSPYQTGDDTKDYGRRGRRGRDDDDDDGDTEERTEGARRRYGKHSYD